MWVGGVGCEGTFVLTPTEKNKCKMADFTLRRRLKLPPSSLFLGFYPPYDSLTGFGVNWVAFTPGLFMYSFME